MLSNKVHWFIIFFGRVLSVTILEVKRVSHQNAFADKRKNIFVGSPTSSTSSMIFGFCLFLTSHHDFSHINICKWVCHFFVSTPPSLFEWFLLIFCCETMKKGGGRDVYVIPWQTHLQSVIKSKRRKTNSVVIWKPVVLRYGNDIDSVFSTVVTDF